ncbi:MAG: YraN family protein [Clostridia bacterium]|nr:YraN family protein [Clostridia bacterium]
MDDIKRGRHGEELAVKFLYDQGYDVITVNYRTREGEIDIIANDDTYLCFVEVKSRIGTPFGTPAEAVTTEKQKRLIKAAKRFIYDNKPPLQPRFDVIELFADRERGDSTRWQITHIKNAFGETEE